jgi:DNA polymerase-3 subunit epsilon
MNWLQEPIVGFDTETTGTDVWNDRIVSASLVSITGGEERKSKQWIINPGVEIPEGAIAVHGITNEVARSQGQAPAEALEEITGILATVLGAGRPVVVFNASFDLTLLEVENHRHKVPSLASRLGGDIAPILDPLVIDKHVDRFRKGKRLLSKVADHYGVELTDAHDAHADACAAAELVPKILDRFPDLSVLSPRELHASQVSWRAEQQTSLCEYFERIGNHEAAASISKAWPLERVSDS